MGAVLEYLTSEVLELAGNAAADNRKQRIVPRHIQLAVKKDDELKELLKDVTISQGGVVMNILPQLLPKATTARAPLPQATRATAQVDEEHVDEGTEEEAENEDEESNEGESDEEEDTDDSSNRATS